MANDLGFYNPVFYAQEALIQLENALGMAGRVYRGYEEERRSFDRGDTINIRRPSTFTAQNAPSTAQSLNTGKVQMTLANWKEVKFSLTDQELAYTQEKIIQDHIRPAAYALADDVDVALATLASSVPWYATLNANPGSVVSDITNVHQVMFDNRVPMIDPSVLHYMVNGTMQNNLLANSAFTQWQGGGQQAVVDQQRGALGQRFGMEIFANQNVQSHVAGALVVGTSFVTSAAVALGATSVVITDSGGTPSLTGNIKKGDVLTLAGNTQQYVATADATAAANSLTVVISPVAVQAYSSGVAVTVNQASYDSNLAFHRNAFALALAPLPEMGNQLGAKVSTITDPKTRLSIRSRIFYVGDSSEVRVALDILYGFTTLDPNLACVGRG